MKETEFYVRPSALAVISTVLIALLLVSTSCSLCQKEPNTTTAQLADRYRILVTAEQMTDPNTILIKTLFLECSDGGQQLKTFLKNESLLASDQKMVTVNSEEHYKLVPGDFNEPDRMSLEVNAKPLKSTGCYTYLLTPRQQKLLKKLPGITIVASPEAYVAFGKPSQISMVNVHSGAKNCVVSASEMKAIGSGIKLDLIANSTNNGNEIIIDLKIEMSNSFPHMLPSGKPRLPRIRRRKSSRTFLMNRNASMLLVSPGANEEPVFSTE
jgi:hypothetical protein